MKLTQRKNNTSWFILAMVLMLAVFVSACGGGNATGDGSQGAGGVEEPPVETPAEQPSGETANALEAIKASGQLRVGTSADYPPYEFHAIVDGKDQIIGFDIEIIKEVAKDLGVELSLTDMGFDGLLTALQSGNLDMVISGMTPTPERAEAVDFSDVYYVAIQKVIVRAEDKATYTSVESLAGKKVGAQLGAIQEGIVTDQMPQSELRALSKLPDLVLDLKSGNVEALVVEEPVANAYIAANPELVLADIQLEQDEAGSAIAMPKGSAALVEAVNATLKRLADEGKIDQFVTDATNAMENTAE
ncbi:transporter substrate-binding domain-containing protein [Paenibacillus antri]|uniref:Transporter substrate-binding domain-containing protein n=1 Tax=Paenibacillus antri TaxID=2582848 RepID=A0A5R9GEK7_9BACL|nr:ABC transporter substrate-binding protein [Paenibacillus antri]TLS51103.1 transporter substrate-binding domain-containing protein [Paenibacillus antri]